MNPIPAAWLVRSIKWGKESKFITLEKSRAIEYAGLHHGTISPLFELPVIAAEEE